MGCTGCLASKIEYTEFYQVEDRSNLNILKVCIQAITLFLADDTFNSQVLIVACESYILNEQFVNPSRYCTLIYMPDLVLVNDTVIVDLCHEFKFMIGVPAECCVQTQHTHHHFIIGLEVVPVYNALYPV